MAFFRALFTLKLEKYWNKNAQFYYFIGRKAFKDDLSSIVVSVIRHLRFLEVK
jgi:hypothetical protein